MRGRGAAAGRSTRFRTLAVGLRRWQRRPILALGGVALQLALDGRRAATKLSGDFFRASPAGNRLSYAITIN